MKKSLFIFYTVLVLIAGACIGNWFAARDVTASEGADCKNETMYVQFLSDTKLKIGQVEYTGNSGKRFVCTETGMFVKGLIVEYVDQ